MYLQVSIILWIYRTRWFITVFTTNLYTEQSTRLRLHYLRPDFNTLFETSSQARFLNVSKIRILDATLFSRKVRHFSSKPTSFIQHLNKIQEIFMFFYQQMHFYLTYKILKFTLKHFFYSHSYMFRSVRTVIRESILSLAKVTFL